jgi:hypothetical protein
MVRSKAKIGSVNAPGATENGAAKPQFSLMADHWFFILMPPLAEREPVVTSDLDGRGTMTHHPGEDTEMTKNAALPCAGAW